MSKCKSGVQFSVVPGDGAQTGHGDELEVQGVPGGGEAAGVLLQDGHSEGHGDGLQPEAALQSAARVGRVAAGLVDHLRHAVQVDVLHVAPGGDAALVDVAG